MIRENIHVALQLGKNIRNALQKQFAELSVSKYLKILFVNYAYF